MITDFIDKRTANVYGIYGQLGGGKTLSAVELMVYFLGLGWTVVSNVKLRRIEGLKGRYMFIDDFMGMDFWRLPCGAPRGSNSSFRSVIVIDECAEFFDQYSSRSPYVHSFLSWLRHSSKRGQFVFLIVQSPNFLESSLRKLVHKWIVCVDMEQFRLPLVRLKIPFCGHLVWRRLFDRYGNLISRGWNFADKHLIGRYYDTAQSIAVEGRTNDFVEHEEPAYIPNLNFFLFLLLLYVAFLFAWI